MYTLIKFQSMSDRLSEYNDLAQGAEGKGRELQASTGDYIYIIYVSYNSFGPSEEY